jgi:hypothetical protein
MVVGPIAEQPNSNHNAANDIIIMTRIITSVEHVLQVAGSSYTMALEVLGNVLVQSLSDAP